MFAVFISANAVLVKPEIHCELELGYAPHFSDFFQSHIATPLDNIIPYRYNTNIPNRYTLKDIIMFQSVDWNLKGDVDKMEKLWKKSGFTDGTTDIERGVSL